MWNSILKRLNASDSIVSLGLGLAVILVLGMLVKNYMASRGTAQTTTTEQAQTQQDGREALPLDHTVASGDTLWSIAVKYYDNGYNWPEIQKANKLTDASVIEKGQVLVIPAISPTESNILATSTTDAPAPSPTTSVPSVGKNYTVVQGDTLWAIAIREYNSGYRWVDIARANMLTNPDLIHTGNVLQLP